MLKNADVVLLCDGLQKQILERPNMQQIQVYHFIAVFYQMKDRFSRFAWAHYKDFDLVQQEQVLNLLMQTIDRNEFTQCEGGDTSKKRTSQQMTSSSSDKTDEAPNVLRNKLVTVNSNEISAAISLV